MPQTQITPRYVNPPRGNARSASVKDDQGGTWGIHPGDQRKYQIGVPVTVDYTERTDQNGRTWYNITRIIGQQAPVVQIQQPQHNVQQRAQQRPHPNPQAQDEAQKSENIFVTTVVQAAIAQQYPLEERQLTLLVRMARSAWRTDRDVASSDPPFPGSPDDYGDIDNRG